MVSSLGHIVRISQTPHEHVPSSADAVRSPPCFLRFAGEAVPRDGWNDNIKGVFLASTEGLRIAEEIDALHELQDRARPAMREDDG